MATSDFFADTYIAAREKFLSAARAARCDLSKYPLRNHTGPYGEELTIERAACADFRRLRFSRKIGCLQKA